MAKDAFRSTARSRVVARVDTAAMRHGLILRVVGDRLVFAPPLVIEAHEIEDIGERLRHAG
jgi:adenosylmethionine-8-amino-7-oxononanoate aminotransferase